MRWITWVFDCFKLEEAPDPIVAGKRLIGITLIGYTFMHVVFFGVPHFTFRTSLGGSEIGFAGATLFLTGMGAIGTLFGVIRRRRASGHKNS